MNTTNGISTPSRTFHKFRSLSELKDESKGGYMETEIKVPQNRVVGGWWVDDGQVVSDYKVITKPQLMYRLNQKLPLITFSGSLESGGSCSM